MFPPGYQTIHKLHHKSHTTHQDRQDHASPCRHAFTDTDRACPICDFQFNLASEPDSFTYHVAISMHQKDQSAWIPEIPFTFSGYQVTLRAPPLFCS